MLTQLFFSLASAILVGIIVGITCLQLAGAIWMLNLMSSEAQVQMNSAYALYLYTSIGFAVQICVQLAVNFER